jgi:CheY-like chemotaxis protein
MEKLILIAEDDPKILKLTRDMLQVSGYITIEATDGKQGVELARARKPDLILMDIIMPEMDGYTACDAIKADKATSEIPVVMITATDLELNKERTEKLGADGYMQKPFTRQELLDIVSQLLPTS